MKTGIFNRFGLEITTPHELKSKLAYEIRKARLEERERIIALLETDDAAHELWWIAYRDLEPHPTSGRMGQFQLMDVVIDIIKEAK